MIGGVEQQVCVNLSAANVVRVPGQSYCEPIFDSLLCWVATPVNTQTDHICPIRNVPEHIRAYKNCSSDGNWSKTDYEACIAYINNMTANDTVQQPVVGDIDEYEYRIVRVMTDIYFIFSIISLLFLLISIFIFLYFRSLHCHRIKIHIHMFISFVIKFVIIIVMVEPGVTKRSSGSFQDVDWLCKTLVSLNYYGNTANMYWMFVEGLYLHNQIAAAVFSTDAPFKLFCFIGWGVPGIIVVAWSVIMQLTYKRPCWKDYSQSNWIYLVLVPFLLVIFVNLLFLINIIRILVTKLRSNNTDESSRINAYEDVMGRPITRARGGHETNVRFGEYANQGFNRCVVALLCFTQYRFHTLLLVIRTAEGNPNSRFVNKLAERDCKKTIRATIILMPLLGLTNVLFLVNPEDRSSFQLAYHITNAILQSTGGIMLSVLYCFLNGEVQRVIKQKWTRFNIQRHLKRGGRSRSSRNSSFMLSQTEQTVVGTSTSSENNTCVNVNNNRYQKVATIIPEEDLVENPVNDMENSVGNLVNDMKNSVGNHVNDTENTVENHVTKVEKTVNNHVNNVEKNRLNNVDDTIILPSAESFDNLEESII